MRTELLQGQEGILSVEVNELSMLLTQKTFCYITSLACVSPSANASKMQQISSEVDHFNQL